MMGLTWCDFIANDGQDVRPEAVLRESPSDSSPGTINRFYWPVEQFLIYSGVEFDQQASGVFLIEGCPGSPRANKQYWYWPKSRKWRAEGRGKVYYSHGIVDFLCRFAGYEISIKNLEMPNSTRTCS